MCSIRIVISLSLCCGLTTTSASFDYQSSADELSTFVRMPTVNSSGITNNLNSTTAPRNALRCAALCWSQGEDCKGFAYIPEACFDTEGIRGPGFCQLVSNVQPDMSVEITAISDKCCHLFMKNMCSDDSQCANGGRCDSMSKPRSCVCAADYTGTYCETSAISAALAGDWVHFAHKMRDIFLPLFQGYAAVR